MVLDFVAYPRDKVATDIGWGYEMTGRKRSEGMNSASPMPKTMLDSETDSASDDDEDKPAMPILSSQVQHPAFPFLVLPFPLGSHHCLPSFRGLITTLLPTVE